MQFNKNFKFIFMSKKLFLEVLNVQLIYILVETMYLGRGLKCTNEASMVVQSKRPIPRHDV